MASSSQASAPAHDQPSPQARALLSQLRRQPPIQGEDIKSLRASMEQALGLPILPPDIRRTALRLPNCDGESLQAHGATAGGHLLYLHGGGYVMGSPLSHRSITCALARHSGAQVLAPDYRLAPEYPFPAALEDALSAYRQLLEEGAEPSRLTVAGDSAGGGLCLATLLAARRERLPLPAAVLCISPWCDLSLGSASLAERAAQDPYVTRDGLALSAAAYLGDTPASDPRASPLFDDLQGLPPLLIQVGGAEVLLDDARRLAQRAQNAGVAVQLEEWPHMFHVWHSYQQQLPEARTALQDAAAFLREHCA